MISEFRIRNFKSIEDLTLKLGRVTVLIGENGSGKSNILEGLGFAGCAAAGKLDNAVLVSRGIRVCEPGWMTSAFPGDETVVEGELNGVRFSVRTGVESQAQEWSVRGRTSNEDESYAGWTVTPLWNGDEWPPATETERIRNDPLYPQRVETLLKLFPPEMSENLKPFLADVLLHRERLEELTKLAKTLALEDFMIFAPENTLLRTPPPEGVVLPLGSKGEGLFRHLESFGRPGSEARLEDLKARLRIFGWFEDFLTPDDAAVAQARLQIRDRWLAPARAVIDQRSANEGFLYLLFYFALLMSPRTPRFFAIDNLDSALNPKLCAALMGQVVELAKKYDKQVICTTHNPAILDGLDLHDDAQRLYSVQRDADGKTTVNRVRPPKPLAGQSPMKLSAAFLSGHIGGLPEHF